MIFASMCLILDLLKKRKQLYFLKVPDPYLVVLAAKTKIANDAALFQIAICDKEIFFSMKHSLFYLFKSRQNSDRIKNPVE